MIASSIGPGIRSTGNVTYRIKSILVGISTVSCMKKKDTISERIEDRKMTLAEILMGDITDFYYIYENMQGMTKINHDSSIKISHTNI